MEHLSRDKVEIAKDWLEKFLLSNGPTDYLTVKLGARVEKITRGELKRARVELEVKSTQTSDTWVWSL